MSFHEPCVAINQVGKIKQIADFLNLYFFKRKKSLCRVCRGYYVYTRLLTLQL